VYDFLSVTGNGYVVKVRDMDIQSQYPWIIYPLPSLFPCNGSHCERLACDLSRPGPLRFYSSSSCVRVRPEDKSDSEWRGGGGGEGVGGATVMETEKKVVAEPGQCGR
jgi:hypothetical protein